MCCCCLKLLLRLFALVSERRFALQRNLFFLHYTDHVGTEAGIVHTPLVCY